MTPGPAGGSTVVYHAEFTFTGLAKVAGPLLKPFLEKLGNDTGRPAEDGAGPPVTQPRRALVTGVTGYIGSRLVPRLIEEGWQVRVLTRDESKVADRWWRSKVEVVEGDATARETLAEALADVDVAYYFLHSMDGEGDFVERDRELARTFGLAAYEAEVGRIVYLSGLHPHQGPLSDHLASRVEVGDLLMASGVPTAVLQAAIILGSGSASFEMLRHLTTRLPAMITPKWLDNRIQPIAIRDVLHLLVGAAVAAAGAQPHLRHRRSRTSSPTAR